MDFVLFRIMITKIIAISSGIFYFIKYKIGFLSEIRYLIYLKRKQKCDNCIFNKLGFCKKCKCILHLKQFSNEKCSYWDI